MVRSKAVIKQCKWVSGINPDMPITQVAEVALQQRLNLITYYVPLVSKRSQENDEFVHQLRVSVRRSQAALELFSPLLPALKTMRLNKLIQKIRKAAGSARDLDVFMLRLKKLKKVSGDAIYNQALEELKKRRKREDEVLKKIEHLTRDKELNQKIESLVTRIRWRDPGVEKQLKQAGPELLEPVAADFFYLAEEVFDHPDLLHDLRLESKRLRYAMELTVAGFNTSFKKELYPQFVKIQLKLGEVNDHFVAAIKLNKWAQSCKTKEVTRCLLNLSEQHQQQYHRATSRFLKNWNLAVIDKLRSSFHKHLKR